MWVYIKSEPQSYTVGFYDPQGEWQPESDHSDREEAAKRVHWLNGGKEELEKKVESLFRVVTDLCNQHI